MQMRGDTGFRFRAFWMLLLLSPSLHAALLCEADEAHGQPTSMRETHAYRRLHETVPEPSLLEDSMADTEIAPSSYFQKDLEPCKIEEPYEIFEHMKQLKQLQRGFYNSGIGIPLSFDVGMRILQVIAPIIRMYLVYLLLLMLRVRRHAAIVRGQNFFLHGGTDSVSCELMDFAQAHYTKTQSKRAKEIRASESPGSADCSAGSTQHDVGTKTQQQESKSPPSEAGLACLTREILLRVKMVYLAVAGTERGRSLFGIMLLTLAIEFTGPAIQSIGQWESTSSDCIRVGISNTSEWMLPDGDLSNQTISMDDPLRNRVPLLWGTGETVGLEYSVNRSELINATSGGAAFFKKTDRSYGDPDDLYSNEDVLRVNISQCLMESVAGDHAGELVSCLGNPEILDLHWVTARHSVSVHRASISSVGLQQALFSALQGTLSDEKDEQYMLKWLPFSESAVYVSYIDEELGGAEVECMQMFEYTTWVCIFYEGDATWIIDPTALAMDITDTTMNAIEEGNEPSLVTAEDEPMPALRFQGIERLERADWRKMALARVAENIARGFTLPKFDAFSTAVTLARAGYLQRAPWTIGVVHMDGRRKVKLSVPWLLAVATIIAFVIYAWVQTARKTVPVHIPMSSWEWYLQGAQLHAAGSKAAEENLHPPVQYDKEFGYVADGEAGEGSLKMTWVDGGAQAEKKESKQSQAK